MWNTVWKILLFIWEFLKLPLSIIGICALIFTLVYWGWFAYFILVKKKRPVHNTKGTYKKEGLLHQLFVSVPRRMVLDSLEREPDFFEPKGIHMFCGEQGCGKTASIAEMILRLQKIYPKAKTITNFALTTENEELNDWHQLLEYTNGHHGVIVGLDEIQNWFMSGKNQLPEGMLEVATQNRKNNRIICCTAQVFTRVNKALREQVTLVYEPHTFFRCFTVVVMYKPVFDSEGNVEKRKYKGIYSFVQTDELRKSYDTYKVIHTLSKEGFKEAQVVIQK